MNDQATALGQYGWIKEYVELLAVPAHAQYQWLIDHGVPTSEPWNQLDDAVPGWFEDLRAHIEISEEVEGALLGLLDFLPETSVAAWGDEIEALHHPDWDRIRARAADVRNLM